MYIYLCVYMHVYMYTYRNVYTERERERERETDRQTERAREREIEIERDTAGLHQRKTKLGIHTQIQEYERLDVRHAYAGLIGEHGVPWPRLFTGTRLSQLRAMSP